MTVRRGAISRIAYGNIAPLLALPLGVLVVVAARWGPDWPAQEFRAWVAAREGLVSWTDRWYAGQPLPGYSVLYPVVAKALGAAGTGLAATVVIAWGCARWTPQGRRRAVAYQCAVAISATVNLVIGQVPFLLGAAFGVLAMRVLLGVGPLRRTSIAAAALAAAACSLASPLAGAFLVVAAPAVWSARGRRAMALAPAVVGPAVSLATGGAGGPFPCHWQTFVCVLSFSALTGWYSRRDRAMVVFAGSYALFAVATFVVPNGLGGNVDRLGKIIAVPLACRLLTLPALARPARRVVAGFAAAGAVLVLAGWWPAAPLISSIERGASDPSQGASYYTGLLGYLRANPYRSDRVEIPFTREHWEAMFVAEHVPIARGWERQTDLQYNGVLYAPLTAAAYARWLNDNAVAYVALPDVPLDYGGTAELAVINRHPDFLQPVWTDQHWRLWRVRDAQPLVTGPARLTGLTPTHLDVEFATAGTIVVRLHTDTRWDVLTGAACTGRTTTGWLTVTATRAGPVRIQPSALPALTGAPGCPG